MDVVDLAVGIEGIVAALVNAIALAAALPQLHHLRMVVGARLMEAGARMEVAAAMVVVVATVEEVVTEELVVIACPTWVKVSVPSITVERPTL